MRTNSVSRLYKTRQRLGLTVREMAALLGVSPAFVSDHETGNRPENLLLQRAIRDLEREQLEKTVHPSQDGPIALRQRDQQGRYLWEGPPCPSCRQTMRLRLDHRSHWFWGPLNVRLACSGRNHPHPPVVLGTPYQHERPRPCYCLTAHSLADLLVPYEGEAPGYRGLMDLRYARNPHTGAIVLIPHRRHLSDYEKRHGVVWCDVKVGRPDGCGGLCWSRGSWKNRRQGRSYHVFQCLTKQPRCAYYRQRLNSWAGKLIITRGRKTSLPTEAQRCQHCGGPTIRRTSTGRRPGEVEVICTNCGKRAPFNLRLKRFVSPRPSGRQPRNDSHRPNCGICHRPMKRHGVSRRSYQRNPLQVPLPARSKLEPVLSGPPSEVIAVGYKCENQHHRCEVWKRPDGSVIWKRRPGRKLPRSHRIAKPQAQERTNK